MRISPLAAAVCLTAAAPVWPASAQPPVPVPEIAAATPATMFVEVPDLVNAYPTRPQAWSRTQDPLSLRLHFTSGTPECYGVSATLQEADDTVVVALRTGTLRTAVDRACIMIALSGALDVPLQQPLGGRTVLSST